MVPAATPQPHCEKPNPLLYRLHAFRAVSKLAIPKRFDSYSTLYFHALRQGQFFAQLSGLVKVLCLTVPPAHQNMNYNTT